MKKIAFILSIFLVSIAMAGCGNKSKKTSTNTTIETKTSSDDNIDIGYQIYLSAVSNGYKGDYKTWLESIKGDEIELRISDGYIQKKYKSESDWTNLLSINDLIGENVQPFFKVDNGYIQYKNGEEGDWTNLLELAELSGKDESETVMQVANGYIQWKNVGDDSWKDLIEINSLIGEKGKEITLSVENDYIVWKYVDDESWNSLISTDTLKGPAGDQIELRENDGCIEWKYKTDEEWTILYDLKPSVQEYNITFDLNGCDGVISPQTIKHGSKITEPDNPEMEGYVFDGWYYKGEKWSFNGYLVTESMTLVAKWEEYATEGLEYCLLDDGTYGVGCGTARYMSKIIVPSMHNGKNVSKIIGNGFSSCSQLNSIILPNSITIIDQKAFNECHNLTSITIPSSTTRIEQSAFYNCYNLETILIPNSVEYIGNAFPACRKLEKVYFDGTIEDWCNITLSANPMSVNVGHCWFYILDDNGDIVFNNKKYKILDELEIPDTITTIGKGQFSGFAHLRRVIIPSSVINIEELAFCECRYLTSITIPSSVKTIEYNVFAGCTSLVEIYNLSNCIIEENIEGLIAIHTSIDEQSIVFTDVDGFTFAVDPANSGVRLLHYDYQKKHRLINVPMEVYYNGTMLNIYSISPNAFMSVDGIITNVSDIKYFYECHEYYRDYFGNYIYCCDCGRIFYEFCGGFVTNDSELEFIRGQFGIENVTLFYKGSLSQEEFAYQYDEFVDYNNLQILFYSENEPIEEGNYWHYDSNNHPMSYKYEKANGKLLEINDRMRSYLISAMYEDTYEYIGTNASENICPIDNGYSITYDALINILTIENFTDILSELEGINTCNICMMIDENFEINCSCLDDNASIDGYKITVDEDIYDGLRFVLIGF